MKLSKATAPMGTLGLMNFAGKHRERLLSSDTPEAAESAAYIAAALASLDAAYAARRPLMALWREVTAVKDAADDSLDSFIAALSYEMLGPNCLDGDRDHPTYRSLFPDGNIRFIQGPDRAEVVQVNTMIAYLKANPHHPMADRAAELETLVIAFDNTLAPVVAAETALRQAQRLEREKREDLRRALRKSAAVLRAALVDERRVDALFPSVEETAVPDEAQFSL